PRSPGASATSARRTSTTASTTPWSGRAHTAPPASPSTCSATTLGRTRRPRTARSSRVSRGGPRAAEGRGGWFPTPRGADPQSVGQLAEGARADDEPQRGDADDGAGHHDRRHRQGRDAARPGRDDADERRDDARDAVVGRAEDA